MFFCSIDAQVMAMLKNFLRKLFSDRCRLTSLELDISNKFIGVGVNLYQCFSFHSDSYPYQIHIELLNQCENLRHLHIHLIYGHILDDIIQRVPRLENLNVVFTQTLCKGSSGFMGKRSTPTFVNWYDKVM